MISLSPAEQLFYIITLVTVCTPHASRRCLDVTQPIPVITSGVARAAVVYSRRQLIARQGHAFDLSMVGSDIVAPRAAPIKLILSIDRVLL